MKSPPSTSASPTAATERTMTAMDCDVSLSHTMDDDITFERVRHMPRRTQFVSTHRKLSWQYDRELKQHERDRKITHVEMARAKIAMAEKLSRLQDAKKEVERKKNEPRATTTTTSIPDRRSSAPSCLPDAKRTDPKGGVTTAMKHSHSASSFPLAAMIPEGTEVPPDHTTCSSPQSAEDKRVSFTTGPPPPDVKSGRRATIAEGVVEAASLPPHLVRRLSQFMDSTSALLMNPTSSRRNDSSSSSSSPGATAGPKPAAQQRQTSDPGPLLSGGDSPERLETQRELA